MVNLLIVIIYISFISLGLPDGLLGAAWPSMYEGFGVPVSYAGIVSMIIAGGTIISALLSERLIKALKTGGVTALSVATTAVALWGFSSSTEFYQICLWGIPYGLGAGSVDAALNNYVAIHYSSRHMSWLHCFWGIGCTAGPYLMSYFLLRNEGWSKGYFTVFVIQIVLTAAIVASLPLWKKKSAEISGGSDDGTDSEKPLGLKRTVSIKGVKEVMTAFFCYCAIESTVGLWAVSYMVFEKGIDAEKAAKYGSLFYIGITVGRFLNGFVSDKAGDFAMIRGGIAVIVLGAASLFLPLSNVLAAASFTVIGLGCAPIYPCLIHSTPSSFGKEASQAVIGVQMASAYVGTTFVPLIFGFLADKISISILPTVVIVIAVPMAVLIQRLIGLCNNRQTAKHN